MKNFGKLSAMLLAFIIFFSGCEDEITTSELTLDLSKTGTIEVYFYAVLDVEEGYERIPGGKKVLFYIDNQEFNPNATGGRWTLLDETDNNGMIRIDEVPTMDDGVTLRIKPGDFIYDQVQDDEGTTEKRLFRADESNVDIYPELTHYHKIYFNDYPF